MSIVYTLEIWRDGGPGVGTLIMRNASIGTTIVDFTRDSPAAGSHTYGVYVNTDGADGFVGFTRMQLLMAHR